MDKLPKSSSRIRIRNRCFKTGRPRGVIRRFKLSRLSFREMALNGEIPYNKSKLVGGYIHVRSCSGFFNKN